MRFFIVISKKFYVCKSSNSIRLIVKVIVVVVRERERERYILLIVD